MSTQERKLEIIEQVLHLELDEELAVVEQALALAVPNEKKAPPSPLRSAEQLEADLQQALRDVEQGQVCTHEQVVAMTQAWRERA